MLPSKTGSAFNTHNIVITHSIYWLAFLLIQVIWQSGFYTCLIHANFTSHYSSPLIPSPPTPNSHSLCYLHIRGGYLHGICQLPHLFLSLLLLQKVLKAMISIVFLGSSRSHTKSSCNYKATCRSTRGCTCIFIVAISKPCAEAWGLQDQGHHNLNSLHPRWNAHFHSKYKHPHNAD